MDALRYLKTWCLDLLFPKFCLGCGAEGMFLCAVCRPELGFSAPTCPVCSRRNFNGVLCGSCQAVSGLRRFLAPFSYRDPLLRELIHAYKYEGVRELKTFFADAIAHFLAFYAIRPLGASILVPIPLHRSRERERGFNQAGLLAGELARRLDLPVREVLRRSRATEPQIRMESYEKRRKNLAGAFHLTNAAAVKDTTVILVDDVSTSGATLYEAARLIRQAGAKTVWAVVIAKG